MQVPDSENMPALKIANVFGVRRESFLQWEQSGCPRNDNGKWNLAHVVQWKLAHEIGKAEASAVGPDGRFTEHQLRKQKADADAAEFRFATMEGRYYKTDLIDQWFYGLASGVRDKLLGLPPVMAPELFGRSIEDIDERLGEAVERIIRELHESTKPLPDEIDE